MKKNRKIRIVLIAAVLLVFVFASASVSFAASGTKRMTAYSCVKSGSTVYCSGLRRIYRVDLNTGSVGRMKKPDNYAGVLRLKSGYLYCTGNGQSGDSGIIFRIDLKTGRYDVLARKTRLKNGRNGFVISGSKIYYSTVSFKSGSAEYTNRVMKLSGKSKKTTSRKIKMTSKASNKRGYKVWRSEGYYVGDDYFPRFDYYLKTPSGSIFLGTEQ